MDSSICIFYSVLGVYNTLYMLYNKILLKHNQNTKGDHAIMLERLEIEERAAKCNMCSTELTIAENMLYGNRCIFCSTEYAHIGLIRYLLLCFLDYRIYVSVRKLIIRYNHDQARMLYLGAISELGAIDIRGISSALDKWRLCRILRRVAV